MNPFNIIFGSKDEGSYVKVTDKKKLVLGTLYLNIFKIRISQILANLIVGKASDCGASIYNKQKFDLKNVKCNTCQFIDVENGQYSILSFDCESANKYAEDAVDVVYNLFLDAIDTSEDKEVLEIMEKNAKSTIDYGKIVTPPKYVIPEESEPYPNIKKLIYYYINRNFTPQILESCQNQIINEQYFGLVDSDVTNLYVGSLRQIQVTDLYANCIKKNDFVYSIGNEIVAGLSINLVPEFDENDVLPGYKHVSVETIKKNNPFKNFSSSFKYLLKDNVVLNIIVCIICIIFVIISIILIVII